MKNYLQKKYSVLLCGVIVIGFLVFLYLKGFRITYAPELENSWEAISAFASWTGVIASAVAILVAIQIPKVIADRQDRITLFEKRFEVYDIIRRSAGFARMIQNSLTHEEIQLYFIVSFGNEMAKGNYRETLDSDCIRLLHQAIHIMRKGAFLFEFDFKEDLDKLSDSLLRIVSIQENHCNFGKTCTEYMTLAAKIEETMIPQIESVLKLD